MTNTVFAVCLAAALAAPFGAQAQTMSSAKADHMSMGKTYSGCLERSSDGTFTLAHAMTPAPAHNMQGMMHDQPMMHDKDSVADNAMASPLTLTATRVKLAKYVGQKVAVTGTSGDTFSVASIKTIAKSCK